MCDETTDLPPGNRMGPSYSTYYAMGSMMPNGVNYTSHPVPATTESSQSARSTERQEYDGQDVLGGFCPSRTPHRVAFKLIPSREASDREIADLLKAKPNELPATVEVALKDSRLRTAPRVHSTLVIKRNGIDSYNGRLCFSGATGPLRTTTFVSSPTAHRCSVKLICAITSQLQWGDSRHRHFAGVSTIAKPVPQWPSDCHSASNDSPALGREIAANESRRESDDAQSRILIVTSAVWRTGRANEVVDSSI